MEFPIGFVWWLLVIWVIASVGVAAALMRWFRWLRD